MTERVCIGVSSLRDKYNDQTINLKKWLENEDNLYLGRKGRIWITDYENNKEKELFHFQDSIWRNNFTVKEYGREECLELYKESIIKKIKSKIVDLETLRGKKLGCYCKLNEDCHIDILIDLLENTE